MMNKCERQDVKDVCLIARNAIARIDELKKRLTRIMGTFDLATGHADTFDELLDSLESELRDVLGYYRQQRAERSKKQEWVGLTDAEGEELMDNYDIASIDYVNAIEAKLKEKNGGDAASDTELRRLGYPL